MRSHRIEIVAGGAIKPPTLGGVGANDTIEIANASGSRVSIAYPVGGNPFSDIEDGTSETLADGSSAKHTTSTGFDPTKNYDLEVDLHKTDFLSSPKIRITGGRNVD